MGIMPIVVIGMVDKTYETIRQHAMSPPEELLQKKRAIADLLGIALNQVTYSCPYESEVERNFELEQLMYQTMDMAFRKSAEYINSSVFDRVTKVGEKKFNYFEEEGKKEDKDDGWVTTEILRTNATVTETKPPICAICFENQPDILFTPCNHVCCKSCSQLQQICHTCRKPIDKKEAFEL